MSNSHVALYGSVGIVRARCDDCGGMALVIRGLLACCDRPIGDESPSKVKRMTPADGARKQPSAREKSDLLSVQGNRCLYCFQLFGSAHYRKGRMTRLRVTWDHLKPFAYTNSSADSQFVAACQVCNSIKSARMFQTLDEAQAYLQGVRESKGWDF